MKALKLLTIIFALVAALSAVVFVLSSKTAKPAEEPVPDNAVFSLASSEYSNAVTPAAQGGKVFLPLGTQGYYFAADLKNNIEFYCLTAEGFTAAPEEV
jgi:hypothetical protein